MNDSFYTIKETNEAIYEEKMSKFIAINYYIETEEQVQNILEECRKKYRDARHVVYAYKLGNKFKYSDDGEPQGTGGLPMYKIIEANKLDNILVVCVRYFGGILLGTGPLARAYMQATKNVIEISNITEIKKGLQFDFTVNYKDFDYAKNIVEKNNGVVIATNFSVDVNVSVKASIENSKKIKEELKKIDINQKFLNEKKCYI